MLLNTLKVWEKNAAIKVRFLYAANTTQICHGKQKELGNVRLEGYTSALLRTW